MTTTSKLAKHNLAKTAKRIGKKTAKTSARRKSPREGTRKAKVYSRFQPKGDNKAAMNLGLKLKLQPTTLRTWFSTWRHA